MTISQMSPLPQNLFSSFDKDVDSQVVSHSISQSFSNLVSCLNSLCLSLSSYKEAEIDTNSRALSCDKDHLVFSSSVKTGWCNQASGFYSCFPLLVFNPVKWSRTYPEVLDFLCGYQPNRNSLFNRSYS